MRIYLFLSMLCTLNAIAQQAPIAIVSANGATKLVNTLDEAAQQAQDNDIIYLPAGNFSGAAFSRKVSIIGVGHHPDSASAAGVTRVNGQIQFTVSAKGSLLEGVIVSTVLMVTDLQVIRVRCGDLFTPCDMVDVENVIISYSIIEGSISGNPCSGEYLRNSKISHSIIAGNFVNRVLNCTYQNCIFLAQVNWRGSFLLDDFNGCKFENCIFPNLQGTGNLATSSFYNNIFSLPNPFPVSSPANSHGNIFNQSIDSIFINLVSEGFNYRNNYRLKATSPGKNAGTDGKDIGIYGGATPYRDGAVPPNPSVRSQQIDAETTPSGTLRVKFNVRVN